MNNPCARSMHTLWADEGRSGVKHAHLAVMIELLQKYLLDMNIKVTVNEKAFLL